MISWKAQVELRQRRVSEISAVFVPSISRTPTREISEMFQAIFCQYLSQLVESVFLGKLVHLLGRCLLDASKLVVSPERSSFF